MSQASLATRQPDPDEEESGYAFEPHVSDAFALRVVEFGRRWSALGGTGELTKKGAASRGTADCIAANGAQDVARLTFEATVRLMEAVSTGVAHALTARSAAQLIEGQHALFSAYLDFLSVPLRWSSRQ